MALPLVALIGFARAASEEACGEPFLTVLQTRGIFGQRLRSSVGVQCEQPVPANRRVGDDAWVDAAERSISLLSAWFESVDMYSPGDIPKLTVLKTKRTAENSTMIDKDGVIEVKVAWSDGDSPSAIIHELVHATAMVHAMPAVGNQGSDLVRGPPSWPAVWERGFAEAMADVVALRAAGADLGGWFPQAPHAPLGECGISLPRRPSNMYDQCPNAPRGRSALDSWPHEPVPGSVSKEGYAQGLPISDQLLVEVYGEAEAVGRAQEVDRLLAHIIGGDPVLLARLSDPDADTPRSPLLDGADTMPAWSPASFCRVAGSIPSVLDLVRQPCVAKGFGVGKADPPVPGELRFSTETWSWPDHAPAELHVFRAEGGPQELAQLTLDPPDAPFLVAPPEHLTLPADGAATLRLSVPAGPFPAGAAILRVTDSHGASGELRLSAAGRAPVVLHERSLTFVHFDPDGVAVLADDHAEATIRDHVHAGFRIDSLVVDGFADWRDSDCHNARLSAARAREGVASWLRALGAAPPEAFVVEAWGERQALQESRDEASLKWDRRAEIDIQWSRPGEPSPSP